MPQEKPTYAESLALLREYVQNPNLLEHTYSIKHGTNILGINFKDLADDIILTLRQISNKLGL